MNDRLRDALVQRENRRQARVASRPPKQTVSFAAGATVAVGAVVAAWMVAGLSAMEL